MKGLLFTYFLTYGGCVVALFRPFVGLCIYYCFTVLRPQTLWFFALPQDGNYSKHVALATLIGWSISGFPRGGSLKRVMPILLTFGGLALIFRMTTWTAINPFVAEPVASAMAKIFLMFFVGVSLLDSPRRLKVLLWVFILSQGYLTYDLNVSYFLSGVNVILMNDGFGSLNNNTFALSLLPGIGIALMTSIFETRPLLRGLALFSALSSVHVVLLSESRGAYLGILAMGAIAAYSVPKTFKTLFLFSLVVLLVALLAGESVRQEFSTIFADELDDSASYRYDTWSASFRAMLDHPFLGVGPQNFLVVSDQYGLDKNRAAHNLYLQTGADTGVTGLFLLVTFYLLLLRRLAKIMSWKVGETSQIDPTIAGVAAGVFSGLIGYLTHSFFSAGVAIETPYLAALLGTAAIRLAYANTRQLERVESSAENMPRRAVRGNLRYV